MYYNYSSSSSSRHLQSDLLLLVGGAVAAAPPVSAKVVETEGCHWQDQANRGWTGAIDGGGGCIHDKAGEMVLKNGQRDQKNTYSGPFSLFQSLLGVENLSDSDLNCLTSLKGLTGLELGDCSK